MMGVAEGIGARRKKISCTEQENFPHGADEGGARCLGSHDARHAVTGTLCPRLTNKKTITPFYTIAVF